jgi:hypothetical protein
MNYGFDPGQRRWLLKAVRESAGELFNLYYDLDEEGLRWRPAEDEWCLKEVLAHLRDADLLYRRQIELITQRHEPMLPDEALDIFPSERNYRDAPVMDLMNEYEAAREETMWLLRVLDEDDWQRCGVHPYQGEISVYAIVRALHEHDLEHLYQARRLSEAAKSMSVSTRRRRW